MRTAAMTINTPHGNRHNNKHDKDAKDNYQIVETKRSFQYDDDGKLIKATEKEEQQGTYVYRYSYGCDKIGLNQKTLI